VGLPSSEEQTLIFNVSQREANTKAKVTARIFHQ